jgi:hypothetical protein
VLGGCCGAGAAGNAPVLVIRGGNGPRRSGSSPAAR